MSHARLGSEWSQTSEVLAAIYNTVRDPKKRSKPYTGSEFNPIIQEKKRTHKIGIAELKELMEAKPQVRKAANNGHGNVT